MNAAKHPCLKNLRFGLYEYNIRKALLINFLNVRIELTVDQASGNCKAYVQW